LIFGNDYLSVEINTFIFSFLKKYKQRSGKMGIKVGINGFGRIGRMVFRAIKKDFRIETTRTFLSLIAAALSTAKPTSEPVAIKMMSGVPS
jgi:hypothetical protein